MGWASTHQRAIRTTTELVVELCHQMENWRRLLRHIERLERQREVESQSFLARARRRNVA